MDVHLHSNSQRHYTVNGVTSRNSRPGEDDLQSLSQEEQECIQFFEETIVSLEESLKEEDRRPGQVKAPASTCGSIGSVVTMSSLLAGPPSPKDHDIIDLVRPQPDLVQTKQSTISSTSPDFQRMMPAPETHFEIKPRHDAIDGLPSEYNPPLPSGSYGSTDGHFSYQPPGCIPTPVLIAQKMAKNQPGGTPNLLPSSHHQQQSLKSEKPQTYSSDLPMKQCPPTSAKPTRYPANISVVHSKDNQNPSAGNVNIHERQAKMLANLIGTSHPLAQEDPQQATDHLPKNTPTRSTSFKDPAPDVSRMEALSKLGLTKNHDMSGGMSYSTPQNNVKHLEEKVPPTTETSTKLPQANFTRSTQKQIHADRKPEVLRKESLKSHEDRNPQQSLSPPAVTKSSYSPPHWEHKAPVSPPSDVSSIEFNRYGGKSIKVHARNEPATSPTSPEPKIFNPALSNPSEFNNYGGKSKVVTPASGATKKNDLPDILSSHIDKSQSLPAKSEPVHIEINSFGGKSRTINPSPGLSHGHTKSFKAPAPAPAPKPHRHTVHVAAQKAAPQVSTPEHRGRSSSMFRSQGITVQFSGRGPMDESRKEALRKLGLLKDP
ncbi:specifically androgen-regulated gene protein isoform X1 [Channa argus]|uniref:specifically androgen-regulated gene protein isoform X1 n=2 Tax=Channa argus TaxID=215402 RepID=UPI0029486273|nr:hypothetical protein Q8A73_021873 [Channa argus]